MGMATSHPTAQGTQTPRPVSGNVGLRIIHDELGTKNVWASKVWRERTYSRIS
jgi:hypothetical protein